MTEGRKPPVRWLDAASELPDELVEGLQAYREIGPSAEQLRLMRGGLKHSRSAAPSRVPVLKLVSLLALAVGLGAVVWSGALPPAPVHVHPPTDVPPAPTAPPAAAEPQAAVVEPTPAALEPAPAAAALAPPAVALQPERRKRASVVATAPSAKADPGTELVLLRRARRALVGAPETSLALVEQHAREFPAGTFVQERELLAIEALARTDLEAARARARTFVVAYPGSLHLERIRVLLGDP